MIRLRHEGAEMTVSETGAEMRSYRDANGRERLWSGDPAVWKGVAPVLFPAIGAVKDGGISIAGTRYAVPRHGFARNLPFEAAAEEGGSVTLTLCESPETLKVYPFSFALSVTHRLLTRGFETRFEVQNRSGRAMPFMLGGHPAFACPMARGERFEDYALRFERPETGLHELTTSGGLLNGTARAPLQEGGRVLALRYEDFDRLDTYIFSGLSSRRVDLVNRDTGSGIRFSFDMDVLAVWTMPGRRAPYVCLEPWQGAPARADESGRFEDKPWHVELGAGQTYACGYRMELL